MVNLVDFIQLGVAGVAVVAIVAIVRRFLVSMDKKDEQFNNTVRNHMDHNTEVTSRLDKTQGKLTYMIESLIKFLDKHNGNK